MHGFTLIELLVVVTIIVVLLALLTPALDQALTVAEKAQCLSNVRNTGQGCIQYGIENRRTLPVYTMTGVRNADSTVEDGCSSYDMRGPWGGLFAVNKPKVPMGIGLLVTTGFFPAGPQLGKIAHCPTMDNSSGPYPGHCMDRPTPWGYGASSWSENKDHRIINGYNYRAPSYWNAGKGHLRVNRVAGSFLLYVDVPDVRFRGYYTNGQVFSHPDGYSRAFGDGSASFLLDPKNIVEKRCRAIPDHPEGHMAGIGAQPDAANEEAIYEYMSLGSVAEE